MGRGSPSSSSGEEDGDENWRSAIESVAAADFVLPNSNGTTNTRPKTGKSNLEDFHNEERKNKPQTPGLKLYQIKAQRLLDDLLDQSIEIVRDPSLHLSDTTESNGGGIKLFSRAPPGITIETVDKYSLPQKKPRIIPGEEIDEKSKKFRRQFRSVAVDGNDVIASAREASRRSLARFETKEAAAKAAAKREEERVLELKKTRGEKWLPSIAKEMQERTRTH
ncbi:uncharacterized protein [Typha latifolia]|uniref:uncharacterized protein isoform X3 n=1 Tax=Typha latifolia TaxID=4733 RepID=UPI003C2F3CAC